MELECCTIASAAGCIAFLHALDYIQYATSLRGLVPLFLFIQSQGHATSEGLECYHMQEVNTS